ncbi:hypothetical protein Lepto7375DRAFT_4949 [Leptolyngbya sp. PCC 7375]|nr:hypothetical protein Lepto7375DRAFT_4949 [Leptolyngbya sp. PCC 7375]
MLTIRCPFTSQEFIALSSNPISTTTSRDKVSTAIGINDISTAATKDDVRFVTPMYMVSVTTTDENIPITNTSMF